MDDLPKVIRDIEDHLLSQRRLDPIERAVYYHLFRHTRLVGKDTGVFALLPLGHAIGISESSARERIRSLHDKKCIEIKERSKVGHLVHVFLPEEIPGVLPLDAPESATDIEQVDFYTGRRYLSALLRREDARCFYCLAIAQAETCVLDHVTPRVDGTDNSYWNIVVACHPCNAAKQGTQPDSFLRSRYRQGLLSQDELQDRLVALEKLRRKELVPDLQGVGA